MSINLSFLKKVRCRFLDRSTGAPVPGVIASLSVAFVDNAARLPVATLCTDPTGYMSFDLKPLIDLELATASGLFVSAPKFGLTNYDLLGSLVAAPHGGVENKDIHASGCEAAYIGREMMTHVATTNGEKNEPPCIVFPIYLENRLRDEHGSESATCERTRLPSIQSPDVCDYKVSPFSFVTPAALKLGNDCCESLLPSSLPIQQYRFNKVVVRRDEAHTDGAVGGIREVKVFDPLESRTPAIKFGEVLDYRQDWYSLGHSLGEIKYSLPLAPGESTQLAVIEWSRDDFASRTDNIRATEFLDHDSRRERAIEDTVEAALREEQGGNSHMGGTSGTASGNIFEIGGAWTGNHAFGGGISYSYGNRDLEGESLQDLRDRVRQASASVRSLKSTVIVQASQAETNTLQTRRVANHNHCHALTIQYYEVLRHYLMRTTFSGRRKAVLIPFALFKFDWKIALRFRTVLEQTLLDPSLGVCFEALIRRHLGNPVTTVKVIGTKEEGVRSNVFVKLGDKVKVRASGLLAFGGLSNTGARGPEGNPGSATPDGSSTGFLAKTLDHYSLLYRIGLGEWRQGSRGPFIVEADNSGEINFGVNDQIGFFGNNTAPGEEYWTVEMQDLSRNLDIPTLTDPSPAGSTATPKMKDASVILKGSEGKGKEVPDVTVRKGDVIKVRAEGDLAMSGSGGVGSGGIPPKGDSRFDTNVWYGQASQPLWFLAKGLVAYSLIYKIGTTGSWQQGSDDFTITVKADEQGKIFLGVNNLSNAFGDFGPTNFDSWKVGLSYPVHETDILTPTDPSKDGASNKRDLPFQDDELCVARLLTHLNSNQGFYNGAVWMLLGAVERRLYLEAALQDEPDILYGMDDKPIAISGNYVAFPYSGPVAGWNDSREGDPKVPIEDIVTLPTRGLFAEAHTGHCNSCEKRDVTRMWDWTEMTAETPPEISGISPGPKGQMPSIAQGQLPTNVIQITQPQAAPDPTGLANALNVLKTPDIFRDMAGLDEVSKLLGELAKASGDANSKALAAQAKEKVDGMKTSTGNNTGTATPSGVSAADAADRFSLLPEIKSFAKEIGLTDAEYKQFALDQMYGTKPSPSSSGAETMEDNLDKYCTPTVRSFSPGNPFEGKSADKSGRTTLRAVVTSAPSGSTWHWSVSDPIKAQIVSPTAHITEVLAGHPGLVDLTFEARDPGGRSLAKTASKLCVPQFVAIYEDAAAFNGQVAAYHLDDVKATLLQRVKAVVDFLMRSANVRTTWTIAPFNEVLPAQFNAGGFAVGKYNRLTIRGKNVADPSKAGEVASAGAGAAKPDEPIDVWPGAYTTPGSDVGIEVANIVIKASGLNMTDPQIKTVWIEIMGRLIGETIAHEIHHALLAFAIPTGHNSPAIPWDLMNRGSERSFLQRTGIEILDHPNFPSPGSYRDGGINAISGVLVTNQALVDGVFRVPPAFL